MESPKLQALEALNKLADECTWDEIVSAVEKRRAAHERATEPVDWDSFMRKVRVLLHDEFPEAESISFKHNADSRTITGVVIASDFAETDNADRQDRVWDILEKHLSVDEQSRILSVIALTPKEQMAEADAVS